MKKIKYFFMSNNAEIMLILGLFFIATATFLINFVAGIYMTGSIFTILGIFMARMPPKKIKRKEE